MTRAESVVTLPAKKASIRRSLIAAAAALGICMTSASSAAAATTSFSGSWESIDLDGSYMILTVSGGDTVRVTFIDTFATMCMKAGARAGSSSLRGSGIVADDIMTVDFDKLRCTNNIVLFPDGLTLEFRYDPVGDTLSGSGVTWYRIRAGGL